MRALILVEEFNSVCMYLYIERFVLHVFQVGHKEWHQVLWEKQLSWVVWSKEVVFIVILDLLFHILLKSMRVFVEDLFKDVVELKKLTTWSTEVSSSLIKTVWLDQVLLKNTNNITLKDNPAVNVILEFLKGLILLSLFPGKLSLLLPYFLLSGGLDLIKFSLSNSIIFSLNYGFMLVLGINNTISNNGLRTFGCGFTLLKEVHDLTHQPWHNFLLDGLLLWGSEDTHTRKLAESFLSDTTEVVFGELSGVKLLMGCLSLQFSVLILDLSSLFLLFASLLSSLESLSCYKLGIYHFLVHFLLALNDGELMFFKDLHS